MVIATDPDIEQAIVEKNLGDRDATHIRVFSAFLRNELCWCGRHPHHLLTDTDADGRSNPRTFALCSSHALHDGYAHPTPLDWMVKRAVGIFGGVHALSYPGHEDTPPHGMELV